VTQLVNDAIVNAKLRWAGFLAGAGLAMCVVTGCERAAATAEAPPVFQRSGSLVLIPETSTLRARLKFEAARADQIQAHALADAAKALMELARAAGLADVAL
jgi:hypothetical protein